MASGVGAGPPERRADGTAREPLRAPKIYSRAPSEWIAERLPIHDPSRIVDRLCAFADSLLAARVRHTPALRRNGRGQQNAPSSLRRTGLAPVTG